jgi:hypothetical protein
MIDRSNIFDGFEEGDLKRLFDESNECTLKVLFRIRRRELAKNEVWKEIGRWRYQVDRSMIDDYFDEGDLEKLLYKGGFKNLKEQIMKLHRKRIAYLHKGRWMYMKKDDRVKINDCFKQGDLSTLFNESKLLKVTQSPVMEAKKVHKDISSVES